MLNSFFGASAAGAAPSSFLAPEQAAVSARLASATAWIVVLNVNFIGSPSCGVGYGVAVAGNLPERGQRPGRVRQGKRAGRGPLLEIAEGLRGLGEEVLAGADR